MKYPHRVLCLGQDVALLETRRLVLSTRFETEYSCNVTEATSTWPTSPFDALVLCHSLSQDERIRALKYAMTRTPSSQIVLIQATAESLLHPGVITVRSFDGPEMLLETLTRILKTS